MIIRPAALSGEAALEHDKKVVVAGVLWLTARNFPVIPRREVA